MNDTRSTVLKVGSLLLDHRNTRIPADRRTTDQRALIHELVEHEDIRGLSASISQRGLFPNERLVVTPSGNRRFVVLEGNRRLAAIKLLLSPELAQTTAQVRYFRRLANKADVTALGRLEVVVVKSRIEAAPIIAALHTKNPKRAWSALQQARFYRELISEGQTPAEVAELTGLTLGAVKSYLRSERLYSLALGLDYPERVRNKLEDRRFPLTTLDRFLESKVGQKFLGIELDDTHGFRGVVHADYFRAVLKKVATDIATVKGLTRKINKDTDFEVYVSGAKKELPKTKVRGSFAPSDLIGCDSGEQPVERPLKPRPKYKPSPRRSKSVIPHGFSCGSTNAKVKTIFDELKKMDAEKQRNSTGVMLRVLMDVALWSYYKDQKRVDSVCDHFDKNRKRRRNNPNWTPSLRELISYGTDKRIFPGMTADGYKSVRSLAARDKDLIVTIETFNAYTHNPNWQPIESELRELWARAAPMLEVILS